MRAQEIDGDELAARLERSRVLVAAGGPLGDERYVRAAIRDAHATDRLLWALDEALSKPASSPAATPLGGDA
jgi:histidinol-phosphate/aromatic aminotransferase/cobyric acid decarboxylase-like protein